MKKRILAATLFLTVFSTLLYPSDNFSANYCADPDSGPGSGYCNNTTIGPWLTTYNCEPDYGFPGQTKTCIGNLLEPIME